MSAALLSVNGVQFVLVALRDVNRIMGSSGDMQSSLK